MKIKTIRWQLFLLLLAPLFIQGLCNKDDAEITADEYVTWQISGQGGELKSPTDSLSFYHTNNTTYIYGQTRTSNAVGFGASFSGAQAAGNYFTEDFYLQANGNTYFQGTTPLQVIVSSYGTAGNYVTGTYSGIIKTSLSSPNYNITGTFRIKNK